MMADHWTRREFGIVLGTLSAGAMLGSAAPGKDPLPFKLGVITDEITQDLGQALDFIAHYSLSYCELRQLWGKNIMSLSQADLERAKTLIDQRHMHVTEIASPIFKYNLPEMPAKAGEVRDTFMANFTDQDTESLLKKSFEIANFLGTPKVRVFSYWRVEDPEKAYPHVRAHLAKAAAMALQNKITLLLENEQTCNVATGKESGRMVRDVNSPGLRVMWDPANAVVLGEIPYPDGYRHVRGLLENVHAKDVKKDPKTGEFHWLPVGAGSVDWTGQCRALVKDGYHGTMSLETHYRRPDGNSVESSRESLEGLLKILKRV
jgi:sugar phosphate isomerase/epimerase